MPQRIIDWLAHSMRCVLITPFGWPVEPEVNRIFAMVSGPTLACAASTAAVGVVAARSANSVALRFGGGLAVTAISTSCGTVAAMARAKASPLAAKTRPGVRMSTMVLSLLEILRQQRIRHRDRRVRNADMHGREAEQRVLDVVARQDRDRPLGRQIALQQRCRDGAHLQPASVHSSACATHPPHRAGPETRGPARPAPNAPAAR